MEATVTSTAATSSVQPRLDSDIVFILKISVRTPQLIPSSSRIALWKSVVIHPNSQNECSTFPPSQHLTSLPNSCTAFALHPPPRTPRGPHLVSYLFIYLFLLNNLPPPKKFSHLMPWERLRLLIRWWNQVSISFSWELTDSYQWLIHEKIFIHPWQQMENTGTPRFLKGSSSDSVGWSVRCHESYLLPAPPHAKIHLHVLHHWVGVRGAHTLTNTHSHTCTDCECNPLSGLVCLHSVFQKNMFILWNYFMCFSLR